MDKVLIAPMTLAGLDGAFVRVLREAGLELVYPNVGAQLTEEQVLKFLPGIKAALAGSEPYSARVLDAFPQLRAIARVGVGYDAVDVEAATKHGCVVTITPGANEGSVAEHAFCLMLGLARDLVTQHLGVKTGGWPRHAGLVALRGKTLGIAGLGRIGKAVALRGAAFNMRLLAYDPVPDNAFAARHQITLVSFEQLLAHSDFLTLHLPSISETRHLINRRTLELMKPTAFLINTARGAIVNEADLLEALKNKRLAGAGLDVFEQEPPGKSPLFEFENVLLTPHAGGADVQSRDDMALSAAQAIVSLARGEWPSEKIVNPEVRTRFRW
ncbi:MAG TPA: phosphoglycerate dehydrogenase [Gemmataceae bacterium]|jgi:phosphoglycerate dehydrogenase-like enzyme